MTQATLAPVAFPKLATSGGGRFSFSDSCTMGESGSDMLIFATCRNASILEGVGRALNNIKCNIVQCEKSKAHHNLPRRALSFTINTQILHSGMPGFHSKIESTSIHRANTK